MATVSMKLLCNTGDLCGDRIFTVEKSPAPGCRAARGILKQDALSSRRNKKNIMKEESTSLGFFDGNQCPFL